MLKYFELSGDETKKSRGDPAKKHNEGANFNQ
jgi:hypothetical protein